MKKIVFFICIAIFSMGCQSDDDSEQINPEGINYTYDLDYTSNQVNPGNIFVQHSVFSRKFIARYDHTFERGGEFTNTDFYRWVPTSVQENNLPIRANTTSFSPIYFYYE